MTKKHFEAAAEIVQDLRRFATEVEASAAQQAFADLFRRFNGAFDRDRFERACVPGANVRARTR